MKFSEVLPSCTLVHRNTELQNCGMHYIAKETSVEMEEK
jgi:hypothetical protein